MTGSSRHGASTPLAKKTRPVAAKPSRRWSSSEEINAVIAPVTADVLALLSDGVPCTGTAIIRALAGPHLEDEIKRTLMRLAVTEEPVEKSGKYALSTLETKLG